MPIYEFVCGECGYEFEKIQSFSASTPVCASCGADNVERQMGKPAIHFKGSGWYINDSKKGGGKKGNNPASAVGESGEGGAENGKSNDAPAAEKSSGESKPAESSKEAAPAKESASAPAKAKTETA